MHGIRIGDKAASMQQASHCGYRDNPGDMWVNGPDAVLIHVIAGLVLVVCSHDNAMVTGLVVGSE